MSQPSAPHERVVPDSIRDGVTRYLDRLNRLPEETADWPDDDGPVTPVELWALRQMRGVPHGQITFFKQDDEIVRCVKQVSEKP